MPLASQNSQPRSISYTGPFLHDKKKDYFCIVDIGASGGFNDLWTPIAPYSSFIGFEPDRAECERLNKKYQEQGNALTYQLYPIGLGATAGTQTLHISNTSPVSDGLMPINEDFWKRFPNYAEVKTVGTTTIETETLHAFVAKNKVDHIDFLKIDVEGAEYPILKASRNVLSEQKVLGILTEYIWEPDVKKGQAGLGEMDAFFRDEGFFMFDLECWRFPRNPMPLGHLISETQPDGSESVTEPKRYHTYGQIIGGNALYFRDPIKSAQNGTNEIEWTEAMVLKFVTLLDLYNYQDYAIEIVDYFRDIIVSADPDALIDSLTPQLGNALVPYDKYFQLSASLYKQGLHPRLRPGTIIPKPRYVPATERDANRAQKKA